MSKQLFEKIDAALNDIQHGWTEPGQAYAMAATILALRPEVSVEIGVYAGKGLVALGLSHKEIGRGVAIGIDPYSAAASAEGQIAEHRNYWSALDHESIYRMCNENVEKYGLRDCVQLVRAKSSEATVPSNIGLLRVDGNHGEAVMADIARYTPSVRSGGVLFLDDMGWVGETGAAVQRAAAQLRALGWRELYRVGDTTVFQKTA